MEHDPETEATALPPKHAAARRLGLFAAVLLVVCAATAITFWSVLFSAQSLDSLEDFPQIRAAAMKLAAWSGLQPIVISGRYDIFRYYGPLTFYIDNRLEAGEFPFWNPLTYGGLPNTGNPQSFIFYPPNLIRSLLISQHSPAATLLSLSILWALHLLLMGLSTFYLARAHGCSSTASFAATFTLVCSALIVRRMAEFHFLTTMAWLPGILLVLKWAFDEPCLRAKLSYALGAALLLGLAILGGFLQVVNLMGLAIGVYGCFYCLLAGTSGGRAHWRAWATNMACVGLVVVVASLIAAATLLPAWELATFTARQKGMETPLFQDLRTWSLKEFFQNLVVFPGLRYQSETIHLSGVLALLLACAAWANRRKRIVVVFALMTLAFLECSFGPPLPLSTLLEKFTPFSQSAYSRAWDFLLLPFAMLVALGVDGVASARERSGVAWTRAAFLVYLGVLCLVSVYLLVFSEHYLRPGLEVVVIPALGLAILVALLLFRMPMALRACFAGLLTVLLFAETAAWNTRYVPYLVMKRHSDFFPTHEGVVHLPRENTRDADPIANRFLYSLRPAMNGADPLHFAAVRDILSGPPRDARPHRVIENWETTRENNRGNLLFKRHFWLARQYATGPLPGKHELFPPTTTVFLPEDTPLDLPRVAHSEVARRSMSPEVQTQPLDFQTTLQVRNNRTTLGSLDVALAHQETAEEEALAELRIGQGSAGALHSALFLHYTSDISGALEIWVETPDRARSTHAKKQSIAPTTAREGVLDIPLPDYPEQRITLTLERHAGTGDFQIVRTYVMSDLADEDRLIRILDRGANYTEMEVGPLPGPRVLSYLDADYPGWRVQVDGEDAPLLRTFDAFKGVYLGEGTHRVRFEFVPKLTYVAIAISIAAAFIACHLAIAFRLGGTAQREPAAPTLL